MAALEPYEAALRELRDRSRNRSLSARRGIDFTSNDYLGLATSTRIADALARALAGGTSIGATGSRLLRGNAPEHEALEAQAAAFFGSQRALFFGGGYVANFAVLSTLPQRDDLVVLDELSHASAREGARAGRAEVATAGHNDCSAIESTIRAWRSRGGRGHPWLFVESLYSMDGDRAPLADLVTLADRHDAFLYIDEAHATGVYGPDGRGLAAGLEGRDNIIVLHTCGKALGGSGALVTCAGVLADFLINRCRPFIFATAPSPLMAVAALEAILILRDEPERRTRLAELVAAYSLHVRLPNGQRATDSQIQPIIVGDDRQALAIALAMQERGFDVRAVRPPTVPEGTARLRISLTLNVDVGAVTALGEAIREQFESGARWAYE